jgi:hypothetical protein
MGGYKGGQIAKSFSADKLEMSLNRFGVLPPSTNIRKVAKALDEAASVIENKTTFAKVLVGDSNLCTKPGDMPQCHQIELSEAMEFIEKRFDKYFFPKNSARVYFQNDIIQFLARKAGLTVVDNVTDDNEANVEC